MCILCPQSSNGGLKDDSIISAVIVYKKKRTSVVEIRLRKACEGVVSIARLQSPTELSEARGRSRATCRSPKLIQHLLRTATHCARTTHPSCRQDEINTRRRRRLYRPCDCQIKPYPRLEERPPVDLPAAAALPQHQPRAKHQPGEELSSRDNQCRS